MKYYNNLIGIIFSFLLIISLIYVVYGQNDTSEEYEDEDKEDLKLSHGYKRPLKHGKFQYSYRLDNGIYENLNGCSTETPDGNQTYSFEGTHSFVMPNADKYIISFEANETDFRIINYEKAPSKLTHRIKEKALAVLIG